MPETLNWTTLGHSYDSRLSHRAYSISWVNQRLSMLMILLCLTRCSTNNFGSPPDFVFRVYYPPPVSVMPASSRFHCDVAFLTPACHHFFGPLFVVFVRRTISSYGIGMLACIRLCSRDSVQGKKGTLNTQKRTIHNSTNISWSSLLLFLISVRHIKPKT